MADMSDTLNDFFSEWTEQDAIESQNESREKVAKADAALAANDWKALEELGLVNRIDGWQEGTYRLEFKQHEYDQMVADLANTPKQLADETNCGLLW